MIRNLLKKLKTNLEEFLLISYLLLAFMKSFIKSNSFEEFVLKSDFTLKEFELKPNKNLDEYIRKNANQFNSWQDMYKKAINEYTKTIKI
jgi:hypothetical protein